MFSLIVLRRCKINWIFVIVTHLFCNSLSSLTINKLESNLHVINKYGKEQIGWLLIYGNYGTVLKL